MKQKTKKASDAENLTVDEIPKCDHPKKSYSEQYSPVIPLVMVIIFYCVRPTQVVFCKRAGLQVVLS